MTRHLPLEGIDNFRDFGDYPALGGRRLKRGRLYRSAAHAKATDADLKALAALGIAVVVDLRRREERAREPSRRPPGFAGVVIVNDEPHAEDSWRNHIAAGDVTAASFRDYMFDYYRKAPFDARHIDLFSRYFQALAGIDGPVLIHCAAGKDRTGTVVALALEAAGVPREAIAADYMASADRIEAIFGRLLSSETYRHELEGHDPQNHAPLPGTIERVLELLDAQYGSALAFLTAHGLTDADLERLRARIPA